MKRRLLTDKQVLMIVDNPNMSNIDLAKRLKVRPALIGTYKSRLRKLGVKLPKNVPSVDAEDTLQSLKRLIDKNGIPTEKVDEPQVNKTEGQEEVKNEIPEVPVEAPVSTEVQEETHTVIEE